MVQYVRYSWYGSRTVANSEVTNHINSPAAGAGDEPIASISSKSTGGAAAAGAAAAGAAAEAAGDLFTLLAALLAAAD